MNKSKLSILILICFLIIHSGSLAQIQNPRSVKYEWKTDTTKRSINLSELMLVLPRQSFPSIDYPTFIEKEKGLKSFYKHEPVIAVEINGQAKAYPLNMLTMHEISNDSLGGIPILPTYCPLCNSSVVYDRRLTHHGKEYLLEIEVSGMLRKSDMVMADKQTESWWQQLTGTAIVGELNGAQLPIIPSLVISVDEFFTSYPAGLILSPETGTSSTKRYGTNPYENYDNSKGMPYARFYDQSQIDNRLPPMERIIDIAGENGYKIYPFSAIKQEEALNDTYDGQTLVIFYSKGTISVLDSKEIVSAKKIGSATVFSSLLEGTILHFKKTGKGFIDTQTESIWNITGRCIEGELQGQQLQALPHSNHFAFAWLSFHPDSEIYGQEDK